MCQVTMLDVSNLSLIRQETPVLTELSFSIKPGAILLITGASGSGKTSLAHCITGLIPQHYPGTISGRIQIGEHSPQTHSIEELTPFLGCMLSDSWNRFFQITVADELAFGPRNQGWTNDQINAAVTETAEQFKLTGFLHRRIDSLSGGQLQRVALAAAFACNPPFLILDEPSSCLDRDALDLLHQVLLQKKSSGKHGIILLEHRLTDFMDITDSVMVLDHGKAVFHSSRDHFLEQVTTLAPKLGIRQPGRREPAPWQALTEPFETSELNPVITLSNITAGYDTPVLNNFNLSIYPGVTALTGPNGSGKTTLAAVLAGLLKPAKGRITYHGLTPETPHLPDGTITALLHQDPSSMLITNSVSTEITEGVTNYNIPFNGTTLEYWLNTMGLQKHAHNHPLKLSTGQMIRTAAAAIMSLHPRILILDEPARGQDWHHLTAILNSASHGHTPDAIIIITHDYKVLHHFARSIIVMEQGQVISHGTVKKEQND